MCSYLVLQAAPLRGALLDYVALKARVLLFFFPLFSFFLLLFSFVFFFWFFVGVSAGVMNVVFG